MDADAESPLGPPAKMAANREELTPMMSQYFELCCEYEDSLVLFQVGDFYEAFCEAAETVSRLLEITLTKREDSSGSYPMAGIPIDNAASYVETLLEEGFRVAVADQVQDPDEASGVVDRAVTRVVTPGTVLDDELLAAGTNNYLACVTADADGYALAFVDVSTGECKVTAGDHAVVRDELDRVGPAEVVTGPDVPPEAFDLDCMHTAFETDAFEGEAARDRLEPYVAAPDAVLDGEREVRACGALLAYAEYTQGDDGRLEYVTRVTRYDPRAAMRLDATALRSLEVFENRTGGDEHTLMGVVDESASALGRRKLEQWLRRPLVDAGDIAARQDAVGELARETLVRDELRERLRDVYDVERLVSRASRGRANARDLRSLKDTLDAVPDVKAALDGAEADLLRDLRGRLDELADVRGLVGRAVHPEPPQEVTEGGIVQRGFDDELDDLRSTEREGREWVAELEEAERERTGIESLKVGHNEVHGYYIEVTNPNLDRVPDDYTRRQTLKNAERFYTPELKRREDEILGAAERADKLEYELFQEVRDDVAAEAERIQDVADALAVLDVLATLAHVAVERDYVRPEMGADGVRVRDGRHPVVETTERSFVPNDTDLREERFAVVTGPNMSGKSTYMRQVALTCLLAQVGSFVPAREADLPVLDRVFTRVGASDDLAGGQSTFMREMSELQEILHAATEDSLVLLDEVGRGTSTTDGLAIAWAVTEFLHDEVGATTLFATHYHELTRVADDLPGVCNLHFTAEREGGDVTFLHSVAEGASSASYGVDVARLAGVPEDVVGQARRYVEDGVPGSDAAPADEADPPATGGELAAELADIDVATTTPLDALNELNRLKEEYADD
ncbi:MAG: DNA mismatch repair protein MutS [Halobacteriaceae archaeon]